MNAAFKKPDLSPRTAVGLNLLLAATFICFGFQPSALAGTQDVGGGAGVVCRDTDGKVKSAELLDLYEGQIRYKYLIPLIEIDPKEFANVLVNRLHFGYTDQELLSNSPAGYLNHVFRQAVDLDDPKAALESPADLGSDKSITIRAGCHLEAIGFREQENNRTLLKIVPEVYAALNATHKAAFWVHEAIYSYYQSHFAVRVSREEGTFKIRRLVAALFAKNTGLNELLETSRFLFSPENGRTYFNASIKHAVFEFVGKSDPLDDQSDLIQTADQKKFYCLAPKMTSRPVAVAGSMPYTKLSLPAGTSSQRLVVNGLHGRVVLNGQESVDVTAPIEIRPVFLKDRADYQQLLRDSEYPFELASARGQRN